MLTGILVILMIAIMVYWGLDFFNSTRHLD